MTSINKNRWCANKALQAYAQASGSDDPLPDLLADLMHYCANHPHANFERVLLTARQSFKLENED